MFRPAFAAILPLAVTLFALPREALADGGEGGPHCKGVHSLWDPLPDACLGVIDTDRPHQTDTPHVVPAGHTQFESGVGELQLGGSLASASGDRRARLVFSDAGYKFGLVSRVDVELLFSHATYVPAQGRFEPPGPLSVRAKLNIVEENGWVPAVTLVPWGFLPVAPSQALRGGPLVFWGWELPAHFEIEVNGGVLFGSAPKPPAALVLASALTYTLVGEFRVFIEAYATGQDIALGTGALWAFTRDMQIDLGTNVGLHGDEPRAMPFVGFSIRQ